MRAFRQALYSVLIPLGRLVSSELTAKLESNVEIDWTALGAGDISGRARAFQSLVGGGMDVAKAGYAVRSDDCRRLAARSLSMAYCGRGSSSGGCTTGFPSMMVNVWALTKRSRSSMMFFVCWRGLVMEGAGENIARGTRRITMCGVSRTARVFVLSTFQS